MGAGPPAMPWSCLGQPGRGPGPKGPKHQPVCNNGQASLSSWPVPTNARPPRPPRRPRPAAGQAQAPEAPRHTPTYCAHLGQRGGPSQDGRPVRGHYNGPSNAQRKQCTSSASRQWGHSGGVAARPRRRRRLHGVHGGASSTRPSSRSGM